MTRHLFRRSLTAALSLALVAALFTPAATRAQMTKVGGLVPLESLTPQERDMLQLGSDFARRCSDTLEKWIADKEVAQDKLFSFLYYPIVKTDPPKFSTEYDALSDRDIPAIQENVLSRSSVLIYSVMVDKNGYLPTHNVRYSQPLTGNLASDLVNNRTKRIFNDRTGIAAARSTAPFLIQRYQRDTGEVMADLSVPIFVHGKHWGAIRLGYRNIDPK